MIDEAGVADVFSVKLSNFEGPFDLLLSLIAKHKLDITEVALSEVTDEFIGFIKAQGTSWKLDQASEFLVVAATLLDLKAARLLPHGEVDDQEDLALIEARDLLFARLLQYRAFKQVAAWIQSVLDAENQKYPRPGGLEEQFATLLPEVNLQLTPEAFAQLAIDAMTPAAQAQVYVAHVYEPKVSVAEQANIIAGRLQRASHMTFRSLIADAGSRIIVVGRFLAILELFKAGVVTFDQLTPLAELVLRWVGPHSDEVEIEDEYDDQAQSTQEDDHE